MSDLYTMFEMDAELEREGITVNFGSVKFLLARAGGRNSAFKKLFQAKAQKFRTQIDQKTMSDAAADRLMAESYAEGVVLGWWSRVEDEHGEPELNAKGEEKWVNTIKNGDGKNVKFSVPECVRLFEDLPDLFTTIQTMAGEAANYRREEDLQDEGNLEKS